MNRNSLLIFSPDRTDLHKSQSDEGDILFRSPHGVPVIWIFAFGGRNIWDPGDDVNARGGVVGRRNPYETTVEVAMTRLEQVEGELPNAPYLWPWLAALPMLRRKLSLKPKTAFVRVAAPWIIGLEEAQVDRWRSATAFAENSVNFASSGRFAEAAAALRELRPYCPFVPDGHSGDLKAFGALNLYPSEEEAIRLSLVTIGEPDAREAFDKVARRDVAKALEEYRKLPPRAAEEIKKVAPKATTAPAKNGGPATAVAPEPKEGFMQKITGFFRKK